MLTITINVPPHLLMHFLPQDFQRVANKLQLTQVQLMELLELCWQQVVIEWLHDRVNNTVYESIPHAQHHIDVLCNALLHSNVLVSVVTCSQCKLHLQSTHMRECTQQAQHGTTSGHHSWRLCIPARQCEWCCPTGAPCCHQSQRAPPGRAAESRCRCYRKKSGMHINHHASDGCWPQPSQYSSMHVREREAGGGEGCVV